jgi:hypothetical protein
VAARRHHGLDVARHALIPNYPGAVKLTRLGDYPRHHAPFPTTTTSSCRTHPASPRPAATLGWTRPLRVISNFPREVDIAPVDRRDARHAAGCLCDRRAPAASSGEKASTTLIRAAARVPGAWLWLMGEGDQKRGSCEELAARGRDRRPHPLHRLGG